MNSDNLIGNILNGRYDILEKIGSGGMASVYKAKDTLLNRFVAIKVLRDSLEGEKNVVTNFIKEAQSSASLVHSNIVSVFDVGEDDGISYMVMELVDGITLKEYIKEKGALPWQEACDYCIQIGQGIGEAHSKNIIHRDIKPQNIIMTKDKILKVTDFGIARALSSDTTIVGGTALGSVHYISPEQARGGFTDARSDIYSLGIVLYEMLTGKVPFDGESAVSVALMHLEKDPINVKCVNMDIPQDLAYVTMKAIAKEQANRYQTIGEMLEDLHAVLAEEPLPSREHELAGAVPVSNAVDDLPDESFDEYEPEDDFDTEREELVGRKAKREKENLSQGKKKNKKNKKDKKDKKKHIKTRSERKADMVATILAIATVLVIGLLAFGTYFILNASQDASVPEVINMTLEEATSAIQNVGLNVSEEVEYSISDDIEEGRVITQDPVAKKLLRKGSDVSLVVSIGSSGGDIEVPDLTNMSFDEAINKIAELGLNYAVVQQYSDDVDENDVIRQSPLAGTKLNADDIVTIHVSKGKESSKATEVPEAAKVTVPDITGQGKEGAEAILQEVGLTLGGIQRKASNASEGMIISQSPQEGRLLERGGVVYVVISSGPAEEEQETVRQTEAPNNGSDDEEDDEPTERPQAQATQRPQSSTESTSTQSPSSSSSSEEEESGNTQSFTVKIPDAANDSVNVEIVANGRTIHNEMHNKSEGSVTVSIPGSGTVSVQAYIDGSKVADKNLEF
ncbi:MAG: Stk1 family PASTA domain-containing Ser/Thr kinase [Monoglobales bacterium]